MCDLTPLLQPYRDFANFKLLLTCCISGPLRGMFVFFQIRQEYARYLEEHHLVEILMWSLYKLMPANPDKMFEFTPDMTVSGK